MAIKFACDHCGEKSITRRIVPDKFNDYGQEKVGDPVLLFKGYLIKLSIVEDVSFEEVHRREGQPRTGDLCRRCLIQAIEEGIVRSDGT